MTLNDVAIRVTPPVALVVGLLICFLGYRLVKLTLGLMGLIVGACGGWSAALVLAPHSTILPMVGAAVGGIIGAILCVWLFLLGVFVLGASAGSVIAAAALNVAGQPLHPVTVLVVALVFGLLALVLQKFMLVLCTSFSGAYLITTALMHFMSGVQKLHPLWFERLPGDSAKTLGYVALAVWIILGLLGAGFQFRQGKKAKPAAEPKRS